MSDHVDGPRSIGDPAADLSDLFAFTSPENPARTVLAANVFPSAGASAAFSNALDHTIVVRRAALSGLGDAAKFKTGGDEIRFSCRFDALEAQPGGARPIQRGTCTLPGGKTLPFVVNDEKGASTPDGSIRVFAGLRSDPFILAWLVETLKVYQNLLQHDNVLSIVIDVDTHLILDPSKGSLFGVIAETIPIPQPGGFIGHDPPRIDWVGKPEQTNMRLNNPALAGTDDLRDLWNQEKPFAIAEGHLLIYRERMMASLANWDARDGKVDWTPAAMSSCADAFLEDYILFDVTKPTSDVSFLEIEKSTLSGRPYETGGGRTVNANVIDILLNWMVNHDKGPVLRGGATQATKPGTNTFPYLASPNAQLQTVAESVDVLASPNQVWALIGQFGGLWHPLMAAVKLTGNGIGQLRAIETLDGKQIVERLQSIDESRRSYSYTMVSGIPAVDYTGVLDVKPKGSGSSVEWRVQYLADGQPTIVVHSIVSNLLDTGLASLKKRFGAAP
ncbi:MAG TPA: DUF4331 family protein [Candidatus Eremiobacteraceae bacterium]|nr:DUF4331 family protein [Candidatus Eremiobacteraceae bacterium]